MLTHLKFTRANKFQLYGYDNGVGHDDHTARIQKALHAWHDIKGKDARSLIQLIQADQIDILIDLGGHTEKTVLPLFAHQPAPVQISYLGYPNTTGLPGMQYLIVDDIVCPEGCESLYTETLLRLSHFPFCYEALPNAPDVSPTPALKNNIITFGSFNHTPKLNPFTIKLWSSVLLAVENSKLHLQSRSFTEPDTVEWFAQQFKEHGVDLSRLEFAQPTSHLDLLNNYRKIDIGLDTYPFNGGTTTCEALWMGVPIVTLSGENYASRMGASILTRIGMKSLIADSADTFVQIAGDMAKNIEILNEVRLGLRDKVRQSSLCDASGFAKDFESQLETAWKAWCSAS